MIKISIQHTSLRNNVCSEVLMVEKTVLLEAVLHFYGWPSNFLPMRLATLLAIVLRR